MKRTVAILTIASAACCLLCLVLLAVGKSWYLPEYVNHGNDVDPHASFSIGSIHCGVSRGAVWLFNDDTAYTGSIITLKGTWGGRRTTERTDWSWHSKRYGIEQVTHIDDKGGVAGRARYGDFLGIYYRHFEWWDQARPWWTFAVSLWYLVALFAVLPGLWGVCRVCSPWRFSLRTLFAAMTVCAVGLGVVVWLNK